MRLKPRSPIPRLAAAEDGFTMLFALLALFVGSLLVAAALTAANGDIKLSRKATAQNKAYYAAVAGVNRYQYQLSANPNYWIECPTLPVSGTTPIVVPQTTDESYTVKTLSATGHTCTPNSTTNKQTSIVETSGSASGTFRILSTGTSNGVTRAIVATFTHPGFLNYVYLSNYEILDPTVQNLTATECEHYYAYRLANNLTKKCGTIVWAAKDKIKGPFHTNDAAAMCASSSSKPTFGRVGQEPPDKIEMNGGHYDGGSSCNDEYTFNGNYKTDGPTLLPPETDAELLESADAEHKFTGKTEIVLHSGTPNTMTVKNNNTTVTRNFPASGVVYVQNGGSCPAYTPFGTDYTGDTGCGNVYVQGTYTESLTVAAANDVIVNGNLQTTEEGGKPSGGGTLGLIATNFVRLYHPVVKTYKVTNSYKPEMVAGTGSKGETCAHGFKYNKTLKKCVEEPKSGYTFRESELLDVESCNELGNTEDEYLGSLTCKAQNSSGGCDAANMTAAEDTNGWGSLENPVIDAAILSTAHSWIVDNFECGSNLGELTIWGSIAQFWRGTVGQGESGYIKNYNYDNRLETEQPPSFLSPSTTSWKLSRETSPPSGFTG